MEQFGVKVYFSNKYRRNNTQKPFSFTVPELSNLGSNISSEFFVQVRQVIFRNYIPLVAQGKNDEFRYVVNNIQYVLFIEQGHYDIDSLIDVFNVSLNAAFQDLSLNYDYNSKHLFFEIPTGCSFQIIKSDASIFDPNYYIFTRAIDKCLEMLGFLDDAGKTFVGPTEAFASAPVNLFGTAYVDINTFAPLNIITASSRNLQTLCTIPIDVEYGGLVVYEPSNPVSFRMSASQLETLNLFVTDEWEDDVVAPQNTLFQIHLLLIPT